MTRRMTRSFARRCCEIIVATGTAFACSAGEELPKTPLALAGVTDSARAVEAAHGLIGPAALAVLDSGNALFRKQAYDAALVQYRAASTLAPKHAAPFFGIYMVARATNQRAMADSALAEIRVRNGPMAPVPRTLGDSAMQRVHEKLGKKSTSG